MVLAQPTKRPHTVHDKKRHGQHHKHGKQYAKHYWPYLPLLVVVIVGLIGNTIWNQQQKVLGAQSNISAQTLLTETNQERSTQKRDGLKLSSSLSQAAQTKANDMATHNYWSHDTPEGKTPWAFIDSAGYKYRVAGENLAYGFNSSNSTVDAWMNSAGHRTNLLNESFSEVGFGIATAPNFQGRGAETIVVAMYAQPAASDYNPAVMGAETFANTGHSIARIQLLTGASWSLLLATFIAGIAVAIFVVRHGVFLHRVLVRSEEFVVKHRAFDVLLVVVGIGGFLLTRATGFIH